MNDKDIIKALELCINNDILEKNCDSCPYRQKCAMCMDDLMRDALDLINRLQAENENYSHNIKKLTEENLILSQKRANMFEILKSNEKGRIRGIKEFADRLKSLIRYSTPLDRVCIDNLVKEMVGEE